MSTLDDIRTIVRIRNPAELGGLIRNRRRQLGIEQSALADKVGVSRQWIIEIEKGKPRAAIGLVLRTLTALDICLDAQTDTARKPKYSTAAIDLDALIESARKPRS
jgi:HTH-type transcriptional regulator/antitoxin HipB